MYFTKKAQPNKKMDEENILRTLLEEMKKVSDKKLADTFIGALNLTEEQRDLVNFVFWLCYMTETDLDSSLKEAWIKSNANFSSETNELAQKEIAKNIKGYRERDIDIKNFLTEEKLETGKNEEIIQFIEKNYIQKRIFNGVENLPSFIDKIRIYEFLFGKTKRTKLLYKIKDIRNDLSHNRIDHLSYENKSLLLRETKEQIIEDYFKTVFEGDLTKSKIWNKLTPKQISEIKKMEK